MHDARTAVFLLIAMPMAASRPSTAIAKSWRRMVPIGQPAQHSRQFFCGVLNRRAASLHAGLDERALESRNAEPGKPLGPRRRKSVCDQLFSQERQPSHVRLAARLRHGAILRRQLEEHSCDWASVPKARLAHPTCKQACMLL